MVQVDIYAIALVSVVTVASPGPTTMLVVSQAIRHGIATAVLSVVGILAADVFFIVLASTGVTVAATSFPLAWSAIRAVSAAYLFRLAVRIIESHLRRRGTPAATVAPQPSATAAHANEPTTRALMVARAFLLHASNVKALMFFSALIPALMPSAASGVETFFAALRILSIHLIVATLVLALYAGAGHIAGRHSSAPKWALVSDLASAAVMLALAGSLMANLAAGV